MADVCRSQSSISKHALWTCLMIHQSTTDINIWRHKIPTLQYEMNELVIIEDKLSGYLYREGVRLHCPSHSNDGIEKSVIRPHPLIFHIGKSHSDLYGNLAVAPVTVTLAMLDVDTQQTEAWRNRASIPNLFVGVGRSKKQKKNKNPVNGAQDNQNVIATAFSFLRRYYRKGGIIWRDGYGNQIILKPYIHMIIGDSMGNNELWGHYQSCKLSCQLKDCLCSIQDLICTSSVCAYITFDDFFGKDRKEVFNIYAKKGLVSLRDIADERAMCGH